MSNEKKLLKIKNEEITPSKESFKGIEYPSDYRPQSFCVGVGASAGGLEALEQFFKNMDSNSGLSFVVVQHLSPDYKSLMVELLSKHTAMKVYRAEDGMEIKPNCIYLIPPKKNMTIFHGKLFLTEQIHNHVINLPIDIFFRSLAEDYGEKAIGIILSGTGSDGTLGIRAIKGNGGMVMAQDDGSAKFDGMPKSAIATGLVDYILPANQMPIELLKYVEHPLTSKAQKEAELLGDETSLSKILSIIRAKIGVDFTYYKPNTIVRRLERRISINQIDGFESYVDFLDHSPKEVNILYKELLIGVTKFFRDQEAFDILKTDIIPRICKSKNAEDPIRIWSVGCSTGEEAYGLAIMFKEHMDVIKENFDIKIFATDLDKESIEIGSAGFYSESIVADISMDRLRKWFIKKEKGYQINENIRKMVIFATHNIIKDPPFSKIDLVCCRNMLIYLKPVMQKKVISLFHFSMNKDGFLFLGSSETLGDLSKSFNTISSKWKIYSYKEGFTAENAAEMLMPSISRNKASYVGTDPSVRISKPSNDINDGIYSIIIDEFVPPSLIVDEDFEIVHVCKDVNKYVKIPAGKISLNVLSLVRKELNTVISIAIHKAKKEKKEVIYKDFKLDDNEFINLIVKPLKDPNKFRNLTYIAFVESKKKEDKNANIEVQSINYDSRQQINDLELELKYTKENLQATIEELGTSNEELQSTNEELISSNEELQSTNEELQSVNEELYTVNSEYQNKIEELTQLNNDINNLLKNTNIGTVFLDRNLLIRKFTPAVTAAINILEMDIGRPIHHISHNTINPNFIEDIENVLRTLIPKEAEVQGKKNNWFLMRILPYRTIENAIDGVVITFFDITERKLFEEQIERKSKLLISVLDNSPMASTILDGEGRINYANQMAESILCLNKDEITSRTYNSISWKITDEQGKPFPREKLPFSVVKRTKQPVFDVVHNIESPVGKKVTLSINGSPVFDNNGNVEGVISTMMDITESRKLEEKIKREHELFFRVLENSPNAKMLVDEDGTISFANNKACQLLGIDSAMVKKGNVNYDELHLSSSSGKKPHQMVIETQKEVVSLKTIIKKNNKNKNGIIYINAAPVFDDKQIVIAAVLSMDTTTHNLINTERTIKLQSELLDAIPFGLFTVDTQSCITSWNKTAQEITGFSANQILGLKIYSDVNKTQKQSESEVICLHLENQSEPILCKEIKLYFKQEKLSIQCRKINLISEDNGKITGAIGYFEKVKSQ